MQSPSHPSLSESEQPTSPQELAPTMAVAPGLRKVVRRRRKSRSFSRVWINISILGMMLAIAAMVYSAQSLLLKPAPESQGVPSDPSLLVQKNTADVIPSPTPSVQASVAAPASELTTDQAIQLIQNWLKVKGKIFAPPYERDTLEQIATGSFLKKATDSLRWLKSNRAYYRYQSQQILKHSPLQNNQITVTVAEQLEFLTARGRDRNQSGKKLTTVTYTFSQNNGVWKISSSQ